MLSYASVLRLLAAACFMSLAMICASTTGAQSGRRSKPTAPIPVPTPEATPTPASTEPVKPAFTFVVGMDKYGDFLVASLNAYVGALRSCAERLDEPATVKATQAEQEMTRADASRQAKTEKETYIVWLQLRPTFPDKIQTNDDSDTEVYVEYTVFAPVTAKVVLTGQTYPVAYRNKRVRVPTATIKGDYYLNQAAQAAADRILGHFHIRLPNTRP